MKNFRIAVWIAVLALAGVLGWFTLDQSRTREIVAEGPFGVPFTLVSQTGQPITEQALRGKPTALFFGFTHCPEVCPTTLFELDGWMAKVAPEGKKLQSYFVTVDPERDTPEIMNQYVSNVSKRITGISGSPDKIAEVIKGFRVYAKKVPLKDGDYTMDHTALVYLMDKNGQFVAPFNLKRAPEEAAADLKRFL